MKKLLGIMALCLVCAGSWAQNVLLFKDSFDPAGSTSLTDPAGRATGTLSNLVKYAWTDANDMAVDGTLNWDADGNRTALNEQPDPGNGTQSMRFSNGTEDFDWAPYLAGKSYEISFTQVVAWSHPLTFGLSDTPETGAWSSWDLSSYDLGLGQFGAMLRYDADNEGGANGLNIAGVFPTATVPYAFRILVNEPTGTAEIFVDGVSRATVTNLDFENAGRYLSFGEPVLYAGSLDDLEIQVFSVGRIAVEHLGGINGLALTWAGSNGVNYTIQRKLSLQDATWQDYAIGIVGSGNIVVTTAVDQVQSFYRVVAESNLALGRPAMASSEILVNQGFFPAQQAVDGQVGTRWSSEFADDQWLAVDLGGGTTVSGVELIWEAAYASEYVIEVSDDGAQWTEVARNLTGSGGTEHLNFAPVTTRWIRMRALMRATPFGVSLWEFRVTG